MVTSEPFIGHGLPNPAKDDQENMIPDESIRQGLPQNSNGVGDGSPADVNTPAGLQTGYSGTDGAPKYTSPAQVQNNFTTAQSKKLETKMIAGLAGSLSSSIPAVRTPTSTPMGAKALGIRTGLDAAANKQKMLAFDMKGMPADLNGAAAKSMQDKIAIIKQGGADTDVMGALASQGITAIKDGPSTIYKSNNTTLVDFAQGIGPVGTQMSAISGLQQTGEIVKGMLGTTQVSDNQMMALTSFADHIGTKAFAESDVAKAVIAGQGEKVPNLMTAHSSLKVAGVATLQDDYLQRRQFEGELYQSPDSMQPRTYNGIVPFAKQASDLQRLRKGSV